MDREGEADASNLGISEGNLVVWQVIGQSRTVSLLKRSLEKGTIASAYLFSGPPHVGKMTLALNLAQALNCEADESPCGECSSCQKVASAKHADVQIIGFTPAGNADEAKTRTEIGIDQIRQVQHAASLPPFEGKYKLLIIDGADYLSTEAANCLLKTLEEPMGRVVFVLLAANNSLLPATVVSRCQRLKLLPMVAGEVEAALSNHWGIEPQKAKFLARLCHGCFGWALSAALDDNILEQRSEKLDRLVDIIITDYEERFVYAAELAGQFSQRRDLVWGILDLWLDFWRDLMLIKVGFGEAVTNIDLEATLADLAGRFSFTQIRVVIASLLSAGDELRQNANPRLVLEVLMLSIPRVKRARVAR